MTVFSALLLAGVRWRFIAPPVVLEVAPFDKVMVEAVEFVEL